MPVRTQPAPSGKDYRAALTVAGRTIPLVEMPKEDDAAFLATTIAADLDWQLRPAGDGKVRVVAHTNESPRFVTTPAADTMISPRL